jgi:mannose-6-phosphate isomerase-like protein (cupin superfamily)
MSIKMTSSISLALALSLLCVAGIAQAQPASGWPEHRNEKYGFSLRYPGEVFKVERTTEAGDGQVFVSEDGKARLLVGALVNASGFTPAAYQDYIARESYGKFKVTYRPRGETWFVLSGEGDGKIFYEKVIFSCSGRLINSFAMIYPADQRSAFDPLVEPIEDSFRAGGACERAGSPAVETTRRRADTPRKRLGQRTVSRSRSPFGSAPRSALADRIARQRGRDVYVILQRTSPPYDRKVVRGYASRP